MVREHMEGCWACQENYAELQALSRAIRRPARQSRFSMIEMARLHRNLRQLAERELLRFAGLLGSLAASVLVVSSVWLVNCPTRHVTVVSPAAVTLPASVKPPRHSAVSPLAPQWERMAMTLHDDSPSSANLGKESNTDLARATSDAFTNWLAGN